MAMATEEETQATERPGREPYVMTAVLTVGAAAIGAGMAMYNLSVIYAVPFSVLLVAISVPVYLYWLSRGDSGAQ